ncbi:MAG: hypothetical protein ACK4NC_06575 [Candidatus Gracilibacteria bacterium]
MNNQIDKLHVYRTDLNAKEPIEKNKPYTKAPLEIAVLGHFKKALQPERLFVSKENPLDYGVMPYAPNVDVHPLETAEAAARYHREGFPVFVENTYKEDFEKALDDMTPQHQNIEDKISELGHTDDLGIDLARRAVQKDPSLSQVLHSSKDAIKVKDVIYFDMDQEAQSIDDVLEAASERVLNLLKKENSLTLENMLIPKPKFVSMKEKREMHDEKKLSHKFVKWVKKTFKKA